MVVLNELVRYTSELLQVERYQDYCPNGLQVEGRREVSRLISGVTASQALLDAAAKARGDAILVHHGYFWRGEDPAVTGIKKRRLETLLREGMSLLAYHLPLDGHARFGNNVRLAQVLGLQIAGAFGPGPDGGIARFGELPEPRSPGQFALHLEQRLGRVPLAVVAGDRPVHRVGWCTGAAQDYIAEAAGLGLDAYLSGEVSEQTVHQARELGIHYFAAGHHATERYGVQALGDHLADRFGLRHTYLELENPV